MSLIGVALACYGLYRIILKDLAPSIETAKQVPTVAPVLFSSSPTPQSTQSITIKRPTPSVLIKPTPESIGNLFSDFRVFHEDKRRILFDVWYQYNGSAGKEDVWIDARLLDKDGILLPAMSGCDYIEAKVVGTKTIAKMDCSFTPSPGLVSQSAQIEICMRRGLGNEYITCTRFPYKKKLE